MAGSKAVRLGAILRNLSYRIQHQVAKSSLATRLYVNAAGAVARTVPSRRLQNLIEWVVTGQNVPWPPLAFRARRVRIAAETQIWIVPHLNEFDQAALFRDRIDYETNLTAWLEQHAAGAYDAVIDIGANVGLYSVFLNVLAQRRPSARLKRIYAFEPNREPYTRMLANLTLNQADLVTPFAAAISDTSGLADFYQPEGHLTNGSLSSGFTDLFEAATKHSLAVVLDAQTLEPLFKAHDRVLVKIDAEGLEPKILAALDPLLRKYHPDLVVEILEYTAPELADLACLKDYSLHQFTQDGLVERAHFQASADERDWLFRFNDATGQA